MTGAVDLKTQLENKAKSVNSALAYFLSLQPQIHNRIKDALYYTLEAPGKRLRGAMTLFCCELVSGGINDDALAAAAAIETVHTYSLIHDDLPAMDNDDFRRGRPSCHKKFDEATAILAGDALLTIAFEFLANQLEEPKKAISMIAELASAAGPAGMIAGQMADLEAQCRPGSMELLEYIHVNKTAKMFRAACKMGAIAGNANPAQIKSLSEYGLKIGLGFQIADDILDVESSSQQLGKTVGKDAAQGKLTFPTLVGMEESRKRAADLANQAVAALGPLGPKAEVLKNLAFALLERTK